jgi:hypothetical protein
LDRDLSPSFALSLSEGRTDLDRLTTNPDSERTVCAFGECSSSFVDELSALKRRNWNEGCVLGTRLLSLMLSCRGADTLDARDD